MNAKPANIVPEPKYEQNIAVSETVSTVHMNKCNIISIAMMKISRVKSDQINSILVLYC